MRGSRCCSGAVTAAAAAAAAAAAVADKRRASQVRVLQALVVPEPDLELELEPPTTGHSASLCEIFPWQLPSERSLGASYGPRRPVAQAGMAVHRLDFGFGWLGSGGGSE
jgi:hypothetical protein